MDRTLDEAATRLLSGAGTKLGEALVLLQLGRHRDAKHLASRAAEDIRAASAALELREVGHGK